MNNDNIKARIAKLLNMTTANGCSEDEQETALKLAATAAAKAGIDLDSLRREQAKASGTTYKPTMKRKRDHAELKVHQVFCAEAAAELMGVQAAFADYGRAGFEFIGREELVEAAVDLMMWLFSQVESLYKQALPRGMTQTDRAEFRRTFKAACAKRTKERAFATMRELKAGRGDVGQGSGNALVLVGHFDTLKDEIFEFKHGITRQAAQAEWQAELARERAAAAKQAEYDAAHPAEAEARRKAEAAAEAAYRKAYKPTPMGRQRTRSMPIGNGTAAGKQYGEQVKLRKELK